MNESEKKLIEKIENKLRNDQKLEALLLEKKNDMTVK